MAGFGINNFMIFKLFPPFLWQSLGSNMLNGMLQGFFYAHVFVPVGGLRERRKNMREKGFSLVDMENLKMEDILKGRRF